MDCEVPTTLKKNINLLQSDNKRERKKALETIRLEFNNIKQDEIINCYDYVQSHLTNCFTDKSDACREGAYNIIIEVINKVPTKEIYLHSIILVLSDRLCGEVFKEESEEVRVLAINLLRVLILKYKSILKMYLDLIINILVKTLSDKDPKVKKESCETVSELARAIPEHFHLQSESLIKPIILNLSHQHYKVRVSAINAIGDAVRYGNTKCLEMACGPLAERLFDQNPSVRIAVSRVTGNWLLHLPDRYSFFYKLLPLMLTSLVDEIPEHSAESTLLWNKAGTQYLSENENDLKDKMDFLSERIDHYPEGVIRPNLGCRTLVHRELSKYLPAIVRELEDWMVDVRVRSAQLLCVTVQHAEENITQHLQKVLPAMYRAFSDDEKGVRINIERTAEMIGYFVPPEVYCFHILPSVEEISKPGAVGVLARVIQTSKADLLKNELHNIGKVLCSVCLSKQLDYQEQLLNNVSALISTCQYDCSLISQDIFYILVSVLGLAANESVASRSQGLLEGLCICDGINLENLFIKHTPYMLENVVQTAEKWTIHSPDRFIFEALLKHAGAAIGLNIDQVVHCFTLALTVDPDPEMALKMLMALSYILNDNDSFKQISHPSKAVHKIIKDVLSPQLIWKAGRSAEVLRNAAISDTFVSLQILRSEEINLDIATDLIPLLLSLVEDSMAKTRKLALSSLNIIVAALRSNKYLSADHINSIWIVVIKRLDDNNDEVRLIAVKTTCVIFSLPMPVAYVEQYQVNIESLYKQMLIHLNDPEPGFQEIMLDSLKKVAVVSPILLRNEILDQSFCDNMVCKDLLLHLDIILRSPS